MIATPAGQSAEGYRLIWYHSRRKAEIDFEARLSRLKRAAERLEALRQKFASPRTRYRSRAKVVAAVETILDELQVRAWITVVVKERRTPKIGREKRGRPGKESKYLKKGEDVRFEMEHHVDLDGLTEEAKCDGIFPLITTERSLSESGLLLAYKKQGSPALLMIRGRKRSIPSPAHSVPNHVLGALGCFRLSCCAPPMGVASSVPVSTSRTSPST